MSEVGAGSLQVQQAPWCLLRFENDCEPVSAEHFLGLNKRQHSGSERSGLRPRGDGHTDPGA